jgi:hypothetical protein
MKWLVPTALMIALLCGCAETAQGPTTNVTFRTETTELFRHTASSGSVRASDLQVAFARDDLPVWIRVDTTQQTSGPTNDGASKTSLTIHVDFVVRMDLSQGVLYRVSTDGSEDEVLRYGEATGSFVFDHFREKVSEVVAEHANHHNVYFK